MIFFLCWGVFIALPRKRLSITYHIYRGTPTQMKKRTFSYFDLAESIVEKKENEKKAKKGKKPKLKTSVRKFNRSAARNISKTTHHNVNSYEDMMITAMDHKSTIIRYAKWLERLQRGAVDVNTFMNKVSPDLVIELLNIATGSTDKKVKLDAIKDFLDRAGYAKVNKVAIAGSIDSNASKEELVNTILGLAPKANIEIVDDDKED